MCIICTDNAIRDIVGVLNPFCRGRLKVNSTIGYDNFMAKKAEWRLTRSLSTKL